MAFQQNLICKQISLQPDFVIAFRKIYLKNRIAGIFPLKWLFIGLKYIVIEEGLCY